MNSDDLSDLCPLCGPGQSRTAHGYCSDCGSQLILGRFLRDCERTGWIAALRWVLTSPPRIWGISTAVCVHGIGSYHPCLACRDEVIRRKIAELEDRKP